MTYVIEGVPFSCPTCEGNVSERSSGIGVRMDLFVSLVYYSQKTPRGYETSDGSDRLKQGHETSTF